VTAHPSPADVKALVRGGISKRQAKEVLAHLFGGCTECYAVLEPERHLAFGAGPGEATPETMEVYSDAIERTIAKVCRHDRYLQREKEKIPLAAEWLEREGLEAIFDPPPELSGLPLYEALLDKSWALRREEPADMVSYARGAAFIATTLNKRRFGKQRWFDFQARAWGELANAYRAADDLDKAGVAFERAFEFLRLGSGDNGVATRLHDLQASYFGTRRWFKLALKSLDAVHAFHMRNGNRHMAGRALVTKGLYTIYSGQPEKALKLLVTALSLIDEEIDPELASDAHQNHIRALIESGQFQEARKALFQNAARFKDFAGKINRIKIGWMRATIDAGLESFQSAELGFQKARRGLRAAGMDFHVALVSLEMSLLHLRQARTAEARKEASKAAKVFRKLKVHRELLVAMGVVQRSFEIGAANVTLLESVIEYVRRAEHDPGLRFEPRF